MTPLGRLNELSDNPLFKKTSLFRALSRTPLGFIDIGAAGGAHPLILPVASQTRCTLFEPDEVSSRELKRWQRAGSPFRKVTIHGTAVGGRDAACRLYLTKSRVNTSLLKPRKELVSRYRIEGFRLDRVDPIRTRALDTVLFRNKRPTRRPGEFIKLDCQGAEYLVLQGARKTLESCVAIWCEVEFFRMYEKQRVFSDLDRFLRRKGFQLYGLYPNFVSAKNVDRRAADTEERIVWADALYFLDPLESAAGGRAPSRRDIDVLLVVAMLTGFFDFALELTGRYRAKDPEDRAAIEKVIGKLAGQRRHRIEKDAAALAAAMSRTPENTFLLAKKFVDAHKGNNSVDFIEV